MEEHGDVDEREVGHFWNLLNYRRRDHSHKWKPIAVGMKTIFMSMKRTIGQWCSNGCKVYWEEVLYMYTMRF